MAVLDMVDRCGRSNSTICSVRGPYQMLTSEDLSFFQRFRHPKSVSHSLKPLNLDISQFYVDDNNDNKPITLPLAHACGVITHK